MAEVFRIAGHGARRPPPPGRGFPGRVEAPREVHYDYSEADEAEREADRLWNDSEPTVPGAIAVPPEATPPPSGELTSIEIDTRVDVISVTPVGANSRRLRILALAAVAMAAAGGLCQWAFAQRKPAAAAVVVTPPPAIIVAMPSPPPEPAVYTTPAAPPVPPVVAQPVPDRPTHHHHHAARARHRARPETAQPGAPSGAADFDPGPRRRLRPLPP